MASSLFRESSWSSPLSQSKKTVWTKQESAPKKRRIKKPSKRTKPGPPTKPISSELSLFMRNPDLFTIDLEPTPQDVSRWLREFAQRKLAEADLALRALPCHTHQDAYGLRHIRKIIANCGRFSRLMKSGSYADESGREYGFRRFVKHARAMIKKHGAIRDASASAKFEKPSKFCIAQTMARFWREALTHVSGLGNRHIRERKEATKSERKRINRLRRSYKEAIKRDVDEPLKLMSVNPRGRKNGRKHRHRPKVKHAEPAGIRVSSEDPILIGDTVYVRRTRVTFVITTHASAEIATELAIDRQILLVKRHDAP